MPIDRPFHTGELDVQQRVGETREAQQNGRIIASSIPSGALKFIEQQAMVVLGSVDDRQQIWASICWGHPGFARALSPETVELDLTQTYRNPHDPV
jgi:predicted pyridoxine 5'-phosphate oxidase superfamily flavin-nucleotide-binding protein